MGRDVLVRRFGEGAAKACLLLALLCFPLVCPGVAQFTAEEIAERPRWEAFLKEAEIIDQKQMESDQGITRPWKLTLRRGDVVRFGLWKNPSGLRGGFVEGWRYEIAAYLLDKVLNLNMVPPTIERTFHDYPGSCQLWIDDTRLYRDWFENKENLDPFRADHWKKAGYIAQLFDNLIGNEDRHLGNVLVTADYRAILIDHSRTFRTSKSFVEGLPFTEINVLPQDLMRKLPRSLVEKIFALTEKTVRDAVGELLTDEEIRAVLARKALLEELIQRIIERYGEEDVLY